VIYVWRLRGRFRRRPPAASGTIEVSA
jgi:hypothetical protein